MTDKINLSSLEAKVLPKLIEGMDLRHIGRAVQLSDTNVRVAIAHLKLRYNVATLEEVIAHARLEFGGE